MVVKAIMWLAAALIVGTFVVSAALGVLYAIGSDDEEVVVRPTPTRRYNPPMPTPIPVDAVVDCIAVAKARGYDVSPLRFIIGGDESDDILTQSELRRLLDACEAIIGR